MQLITSVRVQPATCGTTQQHNRRDAQYMSRIAQDKMYVRQDLTARNLSHDCEAMRGQTLDQRFQAVHDHVLRLTGKDRDYRAEYTRIVRGKTKHIRAWSPIREHVLLCNERTSLADLRRYADECQRRWGITPLQIDLHRDEGHYDHAGKWVPHIHAHLTFEYVNWSSGRSIKDVDTSALQDLAAECLRMERGEAKDKTNREHLERNQYIVRRQGQIIKDLEAEAEDKRKAIDAENGSDIIRGIAGKLGLSAQLRAEKKRKKELQAELNALKKRIEAAAGEKDALASEAQKLRNELKGCRQTIKSLEGDIAALKLGRDGACKESYDQGVSDGEKKAKDKVESWAQKCQSLSDGIEAAKADERKKGYDEAAKRYGACRDMLRACGPVDDGIWEIQSYAEHGIKQANGSLIDKALRWLADVTDKPLRTLAMALVDIALMPLATSKETVAAVKAWVGQICTAAEREFLDHDDISQSSGWRR